MNIIEIERIASGIIKDQIPIPYLPIESITLIEFIVILITHRFTSGSVRTGSTAHKLKFAIKRITAVALSQISNPNFPIQTGNIKTDFFIILFAGCETGHCH